MFLSRVVPSVVLSCSPINLQNYEVAAHEYGRLVKAHCELMVTLEGDSDEFVNICVNSSLSLSAGILAAWQSDDTAYRDSSE